MSFQVPLGSKGKIIMRPKCRWWGPSKKVPTYNQVRANLDLESTQIVGLYPQNLGGIFAGVVLMKALLFGV